MATTLEDAARRSSHRQRALYRLWLALDDAEVTQGRGLRRAPALLPIARKARGPLPGQCAASALRRSPSDHPRDRGHGHRQKPGRRPETLRGAFGSSHPLWPHPIRIPSCHVCIVCYYKKGKDKTGPGNDRAFAFKRSRALLHACVLDWATGERYAEVFQQMRPHPLIPPPGSSPRLSRRS